MRVFANAQMRSRRGRKEQGFVDPSLVTGCPLGGWGGTWRRRSLVSGLQGNPWSLETSTPGSCLWVYLRVPSSLSQATGSGARLEAE